MSDMLSIGASGVRAYQGAITTVSDDIANSATPGYSKRTTTLSNVTASSSGFSNRSVTEGNGVLATSVQRAADPLKADAVRASGADLARTDSAVTWLTDIQSALMGSSLGDRLTSFFTSATAVAADPTASAPRATMLEAATGVASAFTATGQALAQVGSDLDTTATNAATQLNSLAAGLAKVNDGIGRANAGTSGLADLQDQRDSILEQMSALTDVSVTTDAAGRASVKVGGSGGAVLVAGSDAGAIAYSRNSDGTVAFTVNRDGQMTSATPSGGALAGIVDAAQKLAAAQTQLDTVATDFTAGVNTVQAQGQDLNGDTGAALFATGASATDISVSLRDGSGIAAASVDAGQGDNGNLANLSALRTGGGYETSVTNLVAGNAATLAARQTVASAQSTIHDGAVSARDAVSGVNLDSEAVDLLRYQQAYQASSRVIQTARDIFQSILNIN